MEYFAVCGKFHAAFYYGDFYPLTPYSTEESGWLAWQFDRPESGDGLIQAFRRSENSFELGKFRLRGLDPAASYRITDLDTTQTAVLTGGELLGSGLPVTIVTRPGSALLTYEKVTQPGR